MSGYNVVLITSIFWALISEYEKRSNKFLTSLLFSELCCCIPCNKKYFNLFLIGSWTTTSWGIYHREFSVTIPSWNICKFWVFLSIGVRGTHGIQPGKKAFWCMGAVAFYGLYPNRAVLTLGLEMSFETSIGFGKFVPWSISTRKKKL